MMSIAEPPDRQMWQDYLDRLKGLEGAEYERAEQEAWEELQAALKRAGREPEPPADAVE